MSRVLRTVRDLVRLARLPFDAAELERILASRGAEDLRFSTAEAAVIVGTSVTWFGRRATHLAVHADRLLFDRGKYTLLALLLVALDVQRSLRVSLKRRGGGR